MSLKAKLEAVIYAAEEPVTLAQLSALFSTEALEWKAEQTAASAAETEQSSESAPLLNAEFDYQELEQPSEPTAEVPEAESPVLAEAAAEPEEAPLSEPLPEPAVESAPELAVEPAPISPADAEAEEKRLARQRDREVRAILRTLLDGLIATYANDDRGIEIKEIAGGYRMATKPECHDAARMFVKSLKPALKLSLPALETLAVIAYKQPVTAPEVNEIRGVDSSGVFGSLLARKLIATAGRKQVIGRPILYKTTKEFLLKFGLNDVSELPSMEEFEKIAQLEFEDMEPATEGESAAQLSEAAPELSDTEIDPDQTLESDENYADSAVESAEVVEEQSAEVAAEEPAETPAEQPAEAAQPENQPEVHGTAATADSNEAPVVEGQDTTEHPPADVPATPAESTPAEAAPAAPSPLEQAETETVPHE
jgi:segregation and condensation protein B